MKLGFLFAAAHVSIAIDLLSTLVADPMQPLESLEQVVAFGAALPYIPNRHFRIFIWTWPFSIHFCAVFLGQL